MGIVIGRDAAGRRFVANTPSDEATLRDLERVEGVGRRGHVRRADDGRAQPLHPGLSAHGQRLPHPPRPPGRRLGRGRRRSGAGRDRQGPGARTVAEDPDGPAGGRPADPRGLLAPAPLPRDGRALRQGDRRRDRDRSGGGRDPDARRRWRPPSGRAWLRKAFAGAWAEIQGDLDYETWRRAVAAAVAAGPGPPSSATSSPSTPCSRARRRRSADDRLSPRPRLDLGLRAGRRRACVSSSAVPRRRRACSSAWPPAREILTVAEMTAADRAAIEAARRGWC